MKNKKYVLTDKTMKFEGRILHRIKAIKDFNNVKAGAVGGWIESEDNLSHEGDCWIYDEAKAMDSSTIYGNAEMHDNSIICNEAILFGHGGMFDNTRMYNNSALFDDAKMYDNSIMFDNSVICDHAIMCGNSTIYDDAIMRDNTRMHDYSEMNNYAKLFRNGELNGNAELKGVDVLYGTLTCKADKFIEMINPQGRIVTGVLIGEKILYSVGCQKGMTKETFIDRIYNEDGGLEKNPHRKEYLKIIYMIETYLKDEININHI